jgi:hypothetical protein
MFTLDLIASLGGLIIPPVFDFIKKKFIKSENDTPERTLGTLATTSPNVLAGYTEALAKLMDSKVRYFNRDVIGQPSQWIVNLRAAIRPLTVVISLVVLVALVVFAYKEITLTTMDEKMLLGIRLSCESNVSSWLGSRFTIKSS